MNNHAEVDAEVESKEGRSEEEIQWAYDVLMAVKQGMDKASINSEKMDKFTLEFIAKMPHIFEALLTLTPPEHGGVILEVFRSATRYGRTWMKKKYTK